MFLDPPYDADCDNPYGMEHVSGAVREWAIANGNNPKLRIALCGYDGEHAMPGEWECLAWKARGGYGSQGSGAGRDSGEMCGISRATVLRSLASLEAKGYVLILRVPGEANEYRVLVG